MQTIGLRSGPRHGLLTDVAVDGNACFDSQRPFLTKVDFPPKLVAQSWLSNGRGPENRERWDIAAPICFQGAFQLGANQQNSGGAECSREGPRSQTTAQCKSADTGRILLLHDKYKIESKQSCWQPSERANNNAVRLGILLRIMLMGLAGDTSSA